MPIFGAVNIRMQIGLPGYTVFYIFPAMQIHYFTLLRLADQLKNSYQGAELVECFTQDRDELVLGFGLPDRDLYLRVCCGAPMVAVWPMDSFSKAKRNVLSLFKAAVGKKILDIRVTPWDRVMELKLEEGMSMILKMHGLKSNVILVKEGEVIEIFRQGFPEDWDFEAKGMEGPDLHSFHALFNASDGTTEALRKLNPAFDKHFAKAFEKQFDPTADPVAILEKIIQQAKTGEFYVFKGSNKVEFSILPVAENKRSFNDPMEALNTFCRSFLFLHHYTEVYKRLAKNIHKPAKKLEGRLKSYERSIHGLEHQRSAEEIGSILMANLHLMQEGMEKVRLFDFYTNEEIEIKLDPRLKPGGKCRTAF